MRIIYSRRLHKCIHMKTEYMRFYRRGYSEYVRSISSKGTSKLFPKYLLQKLPQNPITPSSHTIQAIKPFINSFQLPLSHLVIMYLIWSQFLLIQIGNLMAYLTGNHILESCFKQSIYWAHILVSVSIQSLGRKSQTRDGTLL